MKRVLITGAAGGIGGVLRAGLKGRYSLLRLADVRPCGTIGPGEEEITADFSGLDAALAATRGMDCVVHLAGIPREAVDPGLPPLPDSRYGFSKVFGEALGRLYADKHGLAVACLRIGSFRERPQNARELRTWISHRDTVQLVRRCIDAPPFHFIGVYGVSANTRNEWKDESAPLIGYRPEDNAEAFAKELESKTEAAGPASDFHGGQYCAQEFDGDPSKIQ